MRSLIKFVTEGPPAMGGHLDIKVFIGQLEQLRLLLKNGISRQGKGVVFRVTNLSHSSPATVELDAYSKKEGTLEIDCREIDVTLRNIRDMKDYDEIPNEILVPLERLLSPITEGKVHRSEISLPSKVGEAPRVYSLDTDFQRKVEKVRAAEDVGLDTFRGALEQINIHGGSNSFKVYSSFPGIAPLTCRFPTELKEHSMEALGKVVSVTGKCRYRLHKPTPYFMEVRSLEILPARKTLPSLRDLNGIAPNITRGKESEQFVREQREEWDK